ncbi:hypothetical protein D9M68_947180 [compost metagenome]
MFFAGYIAPSFIYDDLKFQLFFGIQAGNDQLRIQYFERRSKLTDITGSDFSLVFDLHCDFIIYIVCDLLESHLFKIQNYLSNIIYNTFNRRKLVKHTGESHGRDRITL